METLKEGKEFLRKNWKEGVDCPCCTQFVKLYKRKLNSGMAFALINIYNRKTDDWMNVREYFRENNMRDNNDWTRLGIWGLIEERKGKPEHGGKTMGEWKITEKGKSFVRGELRVPSHFNFFDNELYGFSDTTTSIIEALGNKFNYEELING
jgi:hypothetical protein